VNVLASSISAYLVLTSLMTVRAPSKHQKAIAFGGTVMALAIGVYGIGLGYVATQLPRGLLDGIPAFPYFMFGTIGLLAFIGDVRMRNAGGAYTGPKRLGRHLWRMSFALFIAAMSFFLGQSDEFPKALRVLPVMVGPPLAVLVTMLYWIWRVRSQRATTTLSGVARGPSNSALTAT
jgi:peptidoglycan/LPS O-acetylase OafA/YrhL